MRVVEVLVFGIGALFLALDQYPWAFACFVCAGIGGTYTWLTSHELRLLHPTRLSAYQRDVPSLLRSARTKYQAAKWSVMIVIWLLVVVAIGFGRTKQLADREEQLRAERIETGQKRIENSQVATQEQLDKLYELLRGRFPTAKDPYEALSASYPLGYVLVEMSSTKAVIPLRSQLRNFDIDLNGVRYEDLGANGIKVIVSRMVDRRSGSLYVDTEAMLPRRPSKAGLLKIDDVGMVAEVFRVDDEGVVAVIGFQRAPSRSPRGVTQ